MLQNNWFPKDNSHRYKSTQSQGPIHAILDFLLLFSFSSIPFPFANQSCRVLVYAPVRLSSDMICLISIRDSFCILCQNDHWISYKLSSQFSLLWETLEIYGIQVILRSLSNWIPLFGSFGFLKGRVNRVDEYHRSIFIAFFISNIFRGLIGVNLLRNLL